MRISDARGDRVDPAWRHDIQTGRTIELNSDDKTRCKERVLYICTMDVHVHESRIVEDQLAKPSRS